MIKKFDQVTDLEKKSTFKFENRYVTVVILFGLVGIVTQP
jgi:hypothetical protein